MNHMFCWALLSSGRPLVTNCACHVSRMFYGLSHHFSSVAIVDKIIVVDLLFSLQNVSTVIPQALFVRI